MAEVRDDGSFVCRHCGTFLSHDQYQSWLEEILVDLMHWMRDVAILQEEKVESD